jgi:hypothetical protein
VAGRDAPLEVGSVILKHLNRHRRVVQHATVYAEVGGTSKNMQPDSPSSSTSKEGPEKETGAYCTASPREMLHQSTSTGGGDETTRAA